MSSETRRDIEGPAAAVRFVAAVRPVLADGRRATAHVEHTIVVTDGAARILTAA
jgi:methionine aminopeptidase